jgi:phosphatidate cytidylyltransferase
VAGDTRDGDELFEDLDKFFAPIRDVDWDEPDEPAAHAPQEEHVEVRAGERSAEEPAAVSPESPDEDDDAWYDTASFDVVDDIPVAVETAEVEEEEEVVVVAGDAGDPQADLFDEGWPEDEDVEATEVKTIRIDEEVTVDEVVVEQAPSEEDLAAAADHFAGSVRPDDTLQTEPVDVFGDDIVDDDTVGGDLLTDLGADDVEEDILSDLTYPDEAPRTVVVGGEGLSGPSWQEPASVEVGADVERRGPRAGERDVPAAFMTGLVLAGIALAAMFVGPGAFAIVATVAVLVAQGEFFGVLVKHNAQPATAVGLVAGALMMGGAYFRGEAAIPAMFALGVIATFLWFMTVPAAVRKDVLRNVGLTVVNMAWIPLLAAYLIATLNLPDGVALVVAVVGLTFVYDTAAFLVGSVWGGSFFQRPLAASVSPKKSVEGLIGATLVTIVVSVAMVPSFIDLFDGRRLDALLLAVVIAVAATLGDLAESLIKRDLGIKDMGSILPGHGGILDRIDSLLFVAPAAYLLFRVVFA